MDKISKHLSSKASVLYRFFEKGTCSLFFSVVLGFELRTFVLDRPVLNHLSLFLDGQDKRLCVLLFKNMYWV
jgi:hypothetical protein